jgi:predicted PurR-regulated permease PerM
MAFGLIGLFLGPTVLEVAYTLLDAWVAEAKITPRDADAPGEPTS